MRANLRTALKAEKTGKSLFVVPYPFKFEEDAKSLNKKIDEITELVGTFSCDMCSPEYKKISTKIEWSLNRLSRSEAKEEDEVKEKRRMRAELILALGSLQTKAEGEDSESDSSSSVHELSATMTARSQSRSKVAIYKWDIKFSGERGQSLSSFLERVIELSEARGVSKSQLFKSALDLFTGRALIWYRANKSKFHSWADLVSELRKELLPADYDDKLLEEIRKRTQGRE